MRQIIQHNETMTLHDNGDISRPAIGMGPSGKWKLTGAVTLNNFGRVVVRYSLAEVLAHPERIPWKYKNGKQRTHVTDLDHGTHRMWRSPGHFVR